MNQTITNPNRVIRVSEVCHLTSISRQTLYRLIKLGKFPPQIKLSFSAVGWREQAVLLWITERELESAPSNYSIQ